MRSERTESFRKWATLVTSTLALLITCLREPLTLTLKAAVIEMLRQELGHYETVASSEARWQRHQDTANDVLKRCERELSAIRDLASASDIHGRLLLEVSNRLSSLELKLDQLKKPR